MVDDTGPCWLWLGALHDRGRYGMFRDDDGRTRRAHVWAYERWVGGVPAGKILRHKCDVRECVNPAHLEPGTNADNSADMVSRGRAARGSRHAGARLTEAQVVDIRYGVTEGHFTQREAAAAYGVSEPTISNLMLRRTWTHV